MLVFNLYMSEQLCLETLIPPDEFYDFYGTYNFGNQKPCFIKAIFASKDIQVLMFKHDQKIVLMKRFTLNENNQDVMIDEFQAIVYFTEYKIIKLSKLNLKLVEIIFEEEGRPLSEICNLNENKENFSLSTLDIASKLLNALFYYEYHKIPVSNLFIDAFFYREIEGIGKFRFINLNIPSEYHHMSNLWVNLILQCKKMSSIEELSVKEVENNQDLTKKFYIILKHSLEKPIQIKLLIEILHSIKEETFENIVQKLMEGKNKKENLNKKIESLNISFDQYKKQYEFLVMEYLKVQGEIDKSIKKISKYLPNQKKISTITEMVDFLLSKIIDNEENNKDNEKRNKEFIDMNFTIQKNSIEYLSEKLDNSQSRIDELNQTMAKMKKGNQEFEKIKEMLEKESMLINDSCLHSLKELIKTVNEFNKNLTEAQNKANESISKYLDEKQIRNQEILKISKIIAESNKVLEQLKIHIIITNLETLPETINQIYESIFACTVLII